MKNKIYSKIIIFLVIIILGFFQSNSYAISNTKTAITNWYKKNKDSSGNSTYYNTTTIQETEGGVTKTRTIYKTYEQVVKEGKRGDKLAFILDIARRNPVLCMELGTSEPDSNELYLYTLSYKINFEGLFANRSEDGVTTDKKSKTTDNAKMSYILCNRYSGWYNWASYSGAKEEEHTSNCIKNIDSENLTGYNKFCDNGEVSSSTVGHNGSTYSKHTLYMNSGQVALWDFWREWITGDGNKNILANNTLFDASLFSYGARDIDTYLSTSVSSSTYANKADWVTAEYNNAVSALKTMKTKKYLSSKYLDGIKSGKPNLYNNIQNNSEASEFKYEKITKEAENYASYLSKQDKEKSIDNTKDMNPTEEKKYKYNENNSEKQVNINEEEKNKIVLRDVKNNNVKIVEDGEYYKIGPINIDFNKQDKFGSISSVELYNNEEKISDATNLINESGNKISSSNIQIMIALDSSGQQSDICQKKDVTVLNLQTKENIYFRVPKTQNGVDKIVSGSSITVKVKQVRQLRNSLMVPVFTKDIDNDVNGLVDKKDKQRFIFIDPKPNDSIVEAIFDIPMTPTPTTEKGNLKIVKTDPSGNKWAIEGIKFAVISSEGQTVANLETNANGETTTVELPVGIYRIKETSVPTGYTLRTDTETVSITKNTTLEFKFANPAEEIKKGKLKIIKTYADGITKLAIKGIKFDIISSTGQVVASIETDENGEATTGDLEVGTYTIKETSVPAGYKLRTDTETVIVNENTTREFRFANPMYPTTKIAGIVWLDRPGNIGKETVLDYAYNANGDQLLEGIKVKLQGGSQGTQETTTDSSGRYEFNDVNTSEINDLYVEFEYNGQKYQSVPKLQKGVVSNGSITYTSTNKYDTTVSKAEEGSNRTAYTEKYKTIDNNSGLTYTETTNGNQKVSKVNYNSFSNITASTKLAGINFEQSDIDQDGFRLNVNLGLMERPETDFALYKDIYKASVTKINDSGAEEVKDEQVYNKRSQNGYEGDWAKIVVDESLIYDTGNLISRKYKNSSGTFAGVQLYVDYIIELENQSGVIGMPKDIVDYYDSSIFTIDSVKYANRSGTDYTGAEDIQYSVSNSELKITNTKSLRSGEKVYILVRQKLKDPEGTLGSLPNYNPDDETTRKTSINYAEIKSYYTDDGLIDGDSAPGNFNIGQTSMEDDEAKSPKFIIRLPDVKEIMPSIAGTVWNDKLTATATGEGNEIAKIGNGYNDSNDGDEPRNNVDVKLERKDGNAWSEVRTTPTAGEGVYKFETPGEGIFRISYKIDDGQNDEATIFNVNNIDTTDEYWYKSSNNTSMAKEDNDARNNLNNELENQTKEIKTLDKSIWATTPEFKLEKEYTEDMDAPNTKEYNINFGVAERPKSKLNLSTYIDSIQVIASDGVTVLSDTKNMTQSGETTIGKGLKYTPGNMNGYKERREVIDKDTLYNLEINDSAISNSNITIIYKAIVKNIGDIDFTGENGKYSERYEKRSDGYHAKGSVVKTKIDELVVYIPESLNYEAEGSGKWQLSNKESIKSSVDESILNNIGNSTIAVTKSDSDLVKELAPGKTAEDKIKVTRTLDPVTINNGDVNVITSTEVTKTKNEVGKLLSDITLGNLDPKVTDEGKVTLRDTAEDAVKLTITPETGDNKIPYAILLTGLTILAVGIIIIKKKV